MMSKLKIENLTLSYNGRKILDQLRLQVEANEIAVITGRSGSGKTTLLLCVLGFVSPAEGAIILDGENLGKLPVERRRLAYVPQEYALFPHLSVKENIAFPLAVRGAAGTRQEKKVKELLKIVELPEDFAGRGVSELSGGEKQRVALARALTIEPRLFLLDEPLSAIDPETKLLVGSQLREIIKKLGIPALIISHDPQDARNLGDVIYKLEGGRLEKLK